MSARRFAAPCVPICAPRTSLSASLHSAIDSVLKDLKLCTRRLQAALTSHQAELQVLEKLHYKGNNQHRTALFWRRVVDMRRCARRLEETNLREMVDTIRLSFWGDGSQRTPKALKGAWSYFPDSKSVQLVSQRLIACKSLVDQSQVRIISAHSQFILEVQTGAFLQLTLSLTAIAARFYILLEEIGSAIDQASDAHRRLLQILDSSHTGASETKTPLEEEAGPHRVSSPELLTQTRAEDLPLPDPEAEVLESPFKTPPDSSDDVVRLSAVGTADFMFSTKTSHDTVPIARSTVIRSTAHQETRPSVTTVKRKSQDPERKQKAPRKKKKKDEIDDIFGI